MDSSTVELLSNYFSDADVSCVLPIKDKDAVFLHFHQTLAGKPIEEQHRTIDAYVKYCTEVHLILRMADVGGNRIVGSAQRSLDKIVQKAREVKKSHNKK